MRLLAIAILAPMLVTAEPSPGEVFREYSYSQRFAELDSGSRRPGVEGLRAGSQLTRTLDIHDLRKAIRAEVVVEYWGGHIGTASQQFRVNDGDWIDIPQPRGTPAQPQCYYRTLSRATVSIPFERLRAGANRFQFRAGPQICHSFDWGFYWVYGFTVRVYYDSTRAHPAGEILAPFDGATISDSPLLVAQAEGKEAAISSVEFIARYEDFNWEGDGVWRQWHYRLERGRLRNHAGTALSKPYAVSWDTTWVPDQDQPVEIAARITDTMGMTYLTRPVKVTLERIGRSVRMYKPAGVPENFGVRTGRRKTCEIPVEGELSLIRQARLVLSSWSAAHDGVIELNGKPLTAAFGVIHNFSFDSIPVPARLIRNGANEFAIVSATQEHAAEVNWPGPVLLIEYGRPKPESAARLPWLDRRWRRRLPLTVEAGSGGHFERPVEAAMAISRQQIEAGGYQLVEIDSAGRVVDAAVKSQLDEGERGSSELVFLLGGDTQPGQTRRYFLYFDGKGATGKQQAPAMAVETGFEYEGQASIRVSAQEVAYTYHAEGAGFASLRDRDGKEWIGYRQAKGSAGEYRGIPNLHPGFAHPGYAGERGSSSRVVSQGPLRVRIESVSRDRRWAVRWDLFSSHARMTLLRHAAPYWFLYEGTPAGKLDPRETFYALSDGVIGKADADWAGVLSGHQWAFFGDPSSPRVLFAASHEADAEPDQFYQMEVNMTVFGFGRQYKCCQAYLDRSPARFIFGFAETRHYGRAAAIIESLAKDPEVSVGAMESAP